MGKRLRKDSDDEDCMPLKFLKNSGNGDKLKGKKAVEDKVGEFDLVPCLQEKKSAKEETSSKESEIDDADTEEEGEEDDEESMSSSQETVSDDDYIPSSQEYLPSSQEPSPMKNFLQHGREDDDQYLEYEEKVEYRWLMQSDNGKSWMTRWKRAEKEKSEVRVLEDFGHTIFPNEIWDKAFRYLSIVDLKSLTLVSKTICMVAGRILWEAPNLTNIAELGEFQKDLSELPIRILKTCDLAISAVRKAVLFSETFRVMDYLQELEVCCPKKGLGLTLEILRIISPYVTTLDVAAVRSKDKNELVSKLLSLDFPKLKSVILRTDPRKMKPANVKLFTVQHVRSLMTKLPITELWTNCLQKPLIHAQNNDMDCFYPHLADCKEMKNLKKIVVSGYNLCARDVSLLKSLRDQDGIKLQLQHKHSYNSYMADQLK